MGDFQLTVTIKHGEDQFDVDINKKLHIPSIETLNIARLANMMAENSAIHARWSVLANKAMHEHELAKTRFEIWEKGRHKYHREMLLTDSRKKMTERMIDEEVMSDPEYLRRMEEVLDLQENAMNVKSIAFAWGNRGDRLANISSLMKQEMNRSSGSLPARMAGRDDEGDLDSQEERAFKSRNDD